MVGNDIIDLNEARCSSNWERPRFMQKIFTSKEQLIVAASDDPFTTVWQLWSMKESAYKVFIQAGGDVFFNPKKIECSLYNSNNGLVTIDTTTLKTNTTIDKNYIFSTATINNTYVDTSIFELKKNDHKQQSNFMHQQVLNAYSENNAFKISELQIQKTSTGIPKLFYKNKPTNTSLSITHHGHYGAYSILTN